MDYEIKTCEEYVLNQFFQTKEENLALQLKNQDLQNQVDIMVEKYNELFGFVKKAFENSNAQINSQGLIQVSINDMFVGVYFKEDEDNENYKPLVALTKLIEMVNNAKKGETK